MTSMQKSPDVDKFIVSPNIIYEITLNPDDKHQFPNKQDSRVTNVKASLDDILNRVSTDTKYHLFPEMSMPQYGYQTKNRYSRVHYHGIILFRTPLAVRKFYLNIFHRLTGMCSIQLNPYRPDHWPSYCRKQKMYFKNSERIKNASWEAVKPTLSSSEEEHIL